MNPSVDFYFEKEKKWQKEIRQLRSIILECHLVEELKWGSPCYTFDKKNVVLIHTFKDYCALLFFKGALLKDPKKILIQQTANVQATRQARFTGMDEIIKRQQVLKAIIFEAIELEEAGIKVPLKTTTEYTVPEEFQHMIDKKPSLKKAFDGLTPGRQRGYLLYFAAPKQSKTRASRIEKCIPLILDGKGLND